MFPRGSPRIALHAARIRVAQDKAATAWRFVESKPGYRVSTANWIKNLQPRPNAASGM
jgi:hypothetical protein